MANINFERLENGNVRFVRGEDKFSVPGKAYISSNSTLNKVSVRFDRPEHDFEIDAANDTVSHDGGGAVSGRANIHSKLETDIFFLDSTSGPGGGGGLTQEQVDARIVTLLSEGIEDLKVLRPGGTVRIVGVDDPDKPVEYISSED